jgi:hypothetical protein
VAATNDGLSEAEETKVGKEALRTFVRSLARAAAIEDYRRHNGGGQVDHESGDLR